VIISASANNEVTRGKIPVDWLHLNLSVLLSERTGQGKGGDDDDGKADVDKFDRGFTAYTNDEFEVATKGYEEDVALSDVKHWTAQVPSLYF
jgi:hypothetical protein